MSRGPFLADLTDLLFFHGTQVLTRGCSIKRVLNSPSANESSPSSPGKRASRNLTRNGLLSPLLPSSATMGDIMRFGRGLERERMPGERSPELGAGGKLTLTVN